MNSSPLNASQSIVTENRSYLVDLTARILSRDDPKIILELLTAETPANDSEKMIRAAAVEGNRVAGLASQSMKYGRLRDALTGPLSEKPEAFHTDILLALVSFAKLNETQQRIFLTWTSQNHRRNCAKLFEPLTRGDLNENTIRTLCDGLWGDAAPRDRAARIQETAKASTDQVFRLVCNASLEALRHTEIQPDSEKQRKYLSILNDCAKGQIEVPTAIMREVIAAMGQLNSDEINIFKSYPVSEALFSSNLENVNNIPEELEMFASLRPTNIVTGNLAATCDGYVIVAMTADELKNAANFAEERLRNGICGSLIYLSANPLPASELESLNKIFDTVALSHEDINWYLEDPKQRARHDIALHDIKEAAKAHLQQLGHLNSSGIEAYFTHAVEQKLFNSFKREASIWRAIISLPSLPTQLIFMSFEPAIGFLEKCSSGNAGFDPLNNKASGIAFIGANPSPQTGVNPHNYWRYRRYKNLLHTTSTDGENKRDAKTENEPAPVISRNNSAQRLAIFLHSHDRQYLYTAKAIAALLPPADQAIFTSRDCTQAESELLDGVTHMPLTAAVADFLPPKEVSSGETESSSEPEPAPKYATGPFHSLEKFNTFEEIDANIDKLRQLEEGLEKFAAANKFTHALFIPERPAIFKMALKVFERLGVACANVESSIFGDEPVLGDFLAPRHFVVDPTQKEILHRYHGVENSRIEIGGPAHDYARGLKPQSQISKEEFDARQNVLLCTQSDAFEKNVRLIETTLAAFDAAGLSSDNSMTLMIRPHPVETESRRNAYMALPAVANRDDVKLCNAGTFEQSVNDARFVVTRYSTVLYDARNNFATPIAVNLTNDPFSIDFIGLSICLGASSAEELAKHFEPKNTDQVLAEENTFRVKLKSGIDDPARHILKTIGVTVREGGE